MGGRATKLLAGLATAMGLVFVAGVLVSVDAIDLPGNWRATLGFDTGPPNNPCRIGLYRKSPQSPPASPGHWRFEAEMPRAMVEGSAVAIGPTIYTFGGSAPGNLHRVLAYDVRSHRWSEPTQLPVGLNHSQATTWGGDAYLAGGYIEGAEATSDFWRYDPNSNEWTRLPPMRQPRGGAAAAVIGHKLYVADGAPQTYGVSNPSGPYDSFESYDFETGAWSPEPDAPLAVHHVNATALDGSFYMAGGRTDPERSADEFLRFDPRRERWERLPDLPFGAYSSVGIVTAAGRVVVYGGDDELGWEDGGGSVTPSAWAFDPETSRWRRLPDMRIERHAFGAAVDDGRIYAIGGSYCPGIKPHGPVGTHTTESLPIATLMRAEGRQRSG
jgi:serine/threonine-protein kinase PknK